MAKRKRRGSKKSRNVPLAAIGAGLGSMYTLGVMDAVQHAMNGNMAAAGDAIRARATHVPTLVTAMIPPVITGVMKKIVGPINIFKFGRYRISLF